MLEDGVQEDMELLLPVILRTALDGPCDGALEGRNFDRRSLACLEQLLVDGGTLVDEDGRFIF